MKHPSQTHQCNSARTIFQAIFFCLLYTLPFAVHAQNIAITGTVKDATGAAIPGAAVKIRGTKNGVNTDSLGRFNLAVKAGTVLDISAVGFNDTSINVPAQQLVTAVLGVRRNNLQQVAVNTLKNNASPVDPAAFNVIITGALTSFAIDANIANGVYYYDNLKTGAHIITAGFGPQNGLNTGVELPYFMPKGETRGSRYLFNGYVAGVVVDSGNGIIKNSTPIYNYDKIDGHLLIRKDAQNNIEVDEAQVKAFALKSGDTTYVFTKVPALDANRFFVFIGAGTKYAVFKDITTKFIKSNYTDNGLTQTGNNYDEYVDEYAYYLVDAKARLAKPITFSIKKKSIKEAFSADKQKVEDYFAQHKGDDVDEAFVKGLAEFIK